ncbi:MAG: nicotinate-nucleotide adenylyltransferase [Gammaproteobacteria bacterium]
MLGILGGTFDPVHFGHLRTAVEVKETLGLKELRLIPCREPPHRPRPVASAEMRLAMLELAIGSEPGLLVDNRELERSGPSYTYETLCSLREDFPDDPLALILGIDAFNGLDRWHRARDLPKLAHFIVLHRPGFSVEIPESLSRNPDFRFLKQAREINGFDAGCVLFLALSQLEISSTAIREIIRRNGNPRFLLPDAVLDLIREGRLYH